MKNPVRLALVVALFGAVAAIAASSNARIVTQDTPWRFTAEPSIILNGSIAGLGGQTIYIDGGLAVNSITVNGGTALPFSARGFTAYDFPALGNGVDTLTCAESWAATVTGAAFGDGCLASADLGVDGGSRLPNEVALSCSVSTTSAVKFKLCANYLDGGTYNALDAGFFARTFR